jgi:hypothetical protein
MQVSPGKIALYLSLIFGGGAATGYFAGRMTATPSVSASPMPSRNNDDWRKRFTESMRVRLTMSEEQIKQLDEILDDTRVEYRLLRQRYKPEMDKIHAGQVDKIKKMLRPEQIAEYEKIEREREERMRVRESGPGL